MAMLAPRWLPNAISAGRILLVPVWVLGAEIANRLAEQGGDATSARLWTTLILLAIGGSDVADGMLARRFHLQSQLGATLDAVADKAAQVVLIGYLTLRQGPAFAPMPWWFLALLLARDALLLLGYLGIRRRRGRVDTEHRLHGRIASLVLFSVLVGYSAGLDAAAATPLLLLAAAVVALSTACYARAGVRQFTTTP